ncbi:MAG: hypothetical protein ABII82_09885 [Verrucomicrobiota bacterium]
MTSPQERQREINRLSLLCELDRTRVRLHVERARQAPAVSSVIPPVVADVLDIAKFIPGRWGRWARRLSFTTRILRSLG